MKKTKRAIIMSFLMLLFSISMLVGTTFAYFTDSFAVRNKIHTGTLKVDLEVLEKGGGWTSLKESEAPIFDYDNWEPGYADVKILKVENEGNLALKWKMEFITSGIPSALADVISVYGISSISPISYPSTRAELMDPAYGWSYTGSLRSFLTYINGQDALTGPLVPSSEADPANSKFSEIYLGLALVMDTAATIEYNGMALGATFDIVIDASQLSYEMDTFGSDYDAEALFPSIEVPDDDEDTLPVSSYKLVPYFKSGYGVPIGELPAELLMNRSILLGGGYVYDEYGTLITTVEADKITANGIDVSSEGEKIFSASFEYYDSLVLSEDLTYTVYDLPLVDFEVVFNKNFYYVNELPAFGDFTYTGIFSNGTKTIYQEYFRANIMDYMNSDFQSPGIGTIKFTDSVSGYVKYVQVEVREHPLLTFYGAKETSYFVHEVGTDPYDQNNWSKSEYQQADMKIMEIGGVLYALPDVSAETIDPDAFVLTEIGGESVYIPCVNILEYRSGTNGLYLFCAPFEAFSLTDKSAEHNFENGNTIGMSNGFTWSGPFFGVTTSNRGYGTSSAYGAYEFIPSSTWRWARMTSFEERTLITEMTYTAENGTSYHIPILFHADGKPERAIRSNPAYDLYPWSENYEQWKNF